MAITTIIFDFGDVFINLDKTATTKEIIDNFREFELTEELNQINASYEKGQLTSNEFILFYADLFKTNNLDILIKSWNAIILDFPEYRLKFIETLAKSKKYKLILLSNTNALHIEKVIENMSLERYKRFKRCFDAFYLSHEIHFRKPNLDIYEFVLTKNKLNANEVLFNR